MNPDDRTGAARELTMPGRMIPESAVPSPDAREDRYLGTSADQRERHAPYFEAEWYLTQHPDVRESGRDALSHYLVQGHREGRNPSPLFDTTYYRLVHMGSSDECPLMHYVRLGRFEGLRCRPEGANVYPERLMARADPAPSARPELYDAIAATPPKPEAQSQDARFLGVSPEVRAECAPYFDSDWFLQKNRDVLKSGLDALSHYLTQGHLEGRNPSPFFDTAHYRHRYMAGSSDCPLVHYARIGRHQGLQPHPVIDPQYVASTHSVPLQDVLKLITARSPLIDSLSEWFNPKLYSQLHRDVTIDPVEHFAKAGTAERRKPHPGFALTVDSGAEAVVTLTDPGGKTVYVVRSELPKGIVDQVMAQGALDPSVFAPGHETIPYLVQRRSTDIIVREGFDQRALLDEIGQRAESIILHPGLCVGGAEKYMAQLARALDEDLRQRPLVLTTLATAEADRSALSLEILAPLRSVQVVSLKPHFERARDPVLSLALLLLSLRPKCVFVINSELGLRAIKEYGRVLSSAMRPLVSFFSESPFARGAPYATRYLLDVIPHARVFADNRVVLGKLSDRLGDQVQDRFVHLPQPVDVPTDEAFEGSLQARRSRSGAPPRALWVSRWSRAKAVDVVERLAVMRPDLSIDAYGVHEDAEFPTLPNLHRHPVALDLAQLPLHLYDTYLFTSDFEGMPNIVLELAGRGIPIIASDVGGIRETLDDAAVDFVTMSADRTEVAKQFSAAIDRVRARPEVEAIARLRRARAAVMQHHSRPGFAARLREAIL